MTPVTPLTTAYAAMLAPIATLIRGWTGERGREALEHAFRDAIHHASATLGEAHPLRRECLLPHEIYAEMSAAARGVAREALFAIVALGDRIQYGIRARAAPEPLLRAADVAVHRFLAELRPYVSPAERFGALDHFHEDAWNAC